MITYKKDGIFTKALNNMVLAKDVDGRKSSPRMAMTLTDLLHGLFFVKDIEVTLRLFGADT